MTSHLEMFTKSRIYVEGRDSFHVSYETEVNSKILYGIHVIWNKRQYEMNLQTHLTKYRRILSCILKVKRPL